MTVIGEGIVQILPDSAGFASKLDGELAAAGGGGAKLFAGLTASIGLVGAEALKLGSDFQTTMERLHTQAGVPQADISGLSQSVLKLAGDVGTSPNSLGQALFHVESTFQSTGRSGQQMMEILRVGAEGAKVGGSNLVDTQNALDAAIVSGIPGAQNLTSAMGLLNATVGVGDMTMQDLADALSSGVLPVVKNYGLSLRDVGATLAVFGDNNIRGAAAGTALRMSVQALAVPVKGGEAALKAMGIQTGQLAKDMQTGGIVKAMQDLHDHMDAAGITGDAVGEKLTEVFGKRAGTGVGVLYNSLDLLKSKFPELDKSAGGFDDAWTQTTKTFKQQVADITAQVQAWGISLGTWLIPKVQELAHAIVDASRWLGDHKAVLIELAFIIGVPLVAAIGAYVVSMAAAALATLAAMAPLLLIGAVVGGVVLAILYLKDHWRDAWDEIKGLASAAYDWVRKHLLLIAEIVLAPIAPLILLWQHWDELWGLIKNIASDAWDWLRRTISTGVDDVVGFFQALPGRVLDALASLAGDLFDLGTRALAHMYDAVVSGVGDLVGYAQSIPGQILAGVGNLADLLYQAGKDLISGLVNGIKSVASDVAKAAKNVAEAAVGAVKDFLGIGSPSKVFHEIGVNLNQGLAEGITASAHHPLAALTLATNQLIVGGQLGAVRAAAATSTSISTSQTNHIYGADPAEVVAQTMRALNWAAGV